MSKGLKDQHLLMESTIRMTKVVTLALVVVATFSSTAAGYKFCFRSRDLNKCQDPLIQSSDPLPPRNSNCCLSKDAMYYVEVDVPNVSFLFMNVFAHEGIKNCLPCPSDIGNSGSCSRKCPPGKICALRHGKEKCLCNRSCQSAQNKSKVCGRDNKTYKHECDLLRKACQNRRNNSVAYDGPCQIGCSQVKCRGNYTCITDQYDKAHCISCDTLPPCTNASKTDGPVCGADGVQYSSSCALRLETCRQGKSIGVAYHANCVENAVCDNINCGDNICVMDAAGRPRCISCSCREESYRNGHDANIDQKDKSVCGTDLRTYRSYCSLRRQVCATKTFIEVKYPGRCKGDNQLPVQPDDQQSTTAPQQCEQMEKYYITLKDLKTILQKDLGLNVTSNRQPGHRNKIVLMGTLIERLKKKWKRIQNSL